MLNKVKLMDCYDFRRAQQTIKLTSKDDSQFESTGNIFYLSEDQRLVVDFDKVKTNYLNELHLSEEYAASVDTLFQDRNQYVYFVEFKNGEFENHDITKKVKDSLLIFCDITKCSIEYTRNEAGFMLVVNDERLDRLNYQQKKALGLAQKGRFDIALFGLNKLRGYCFDKVSVLSASQFDKWVKKIDILNN